MNSYKPRLERRHDDVDRVFYGSEFRASARKMLARDIFLVEITKKPMMKSKSAKGGRDKKGVRMSFIP